MTLRARLQRFPTENTQLVDIMYDSELLIITLFFDSVLQILLFSLQIYLAIIFLNDYLSNGLFEQQSKIQRCSDVQFI